MLKCMIFIETPICMKKNNSSTIITINFCFRWLFRCVALAVKPLFNITLIHPMLIFNTFILVIPQVTIWFLTLIILEFYLLLIITFQGINLTFTILLVNLVTVFIMSEKHTIYGDAIWHKHIKLVPVELSLTVVTHLLNCA